MNFRAIFRGTIFSIVPVIATLLVSALLVYFNVISEQTASIIIFAAAILGVFISAFGIVRTNEHKLLLNALGIAFMFALIIFLISLIVNGKPVFHTRTLTLIGAAFLASFLGALFGK